VRTVGALRLPHHLRRRLRRVADSGPTVGDEQPPTGPAAGVSFMLTTSGSTGLPKVVPLGTAAVGRFVAWAGPTFGIGADTTVPNYAPLNFDLCLLTSGRRWRTAGRVVLVDPERAANGCGIWSTCWSGTGPGWAGGADVLRSAAGRRRPRRRALRLRRARDVHR
jgi:non-ribosomal peptide synthetase component F